MQEQIIAVQKMQDYILTHLNETITLTHLSKVALFSPWHSYRLFKEYTGFTPAQYIRRLKLSQSALQLRDNKTSVTSLAFALGFQSVEGYQRAFKREFGYNPNEYAQAPAPICLFIPYGVIFNEIRKKYKQVEEAADVSIQVITKPQRKIILKRGVKATNYFEYCDEVGCEVWGLLLSMGSLIGEPVCLWLPDHYKKSNTSTYVQGVEVAIDYNGPIPEDFDVITLSKSDYLLFQGEPFEKKDYCKAIEGVQTTIKNFDFLAHGYCWNKDNPRIQLEPIGSRGYIEMLPITRLEK